MPDPQIRLETLRLKPGLNLKLKGRVLSSLDRLVLTWIIHLLVDNPG